MGYTRHDAVLAVLRDYDFDKPGVDALVALRDSMPEEERRYFVGPVVGINGYTTFALLPDGSNEDWEESDSMDKWRRKFIEAVQMAKYPQFVHLQFSGDDESTVIHKTTDYSAGVAEGALAIRVDEDGEAASPGDNGDRPEPEGVI